jgi:type II secretory pathway predicted ATPase ExeA
MAVHESLEQRIIVRYHCPGLTRDEVHGYLTNRLQRSGVSQPLFEPNAIEALYQGSNGLPRKLNRAAHYALSAAALDKARMVNADHVQRAFEEFRQ